MPNIYKSESAIILILNELKSAFIDSENLPAADAIDLAMHEIGSIKGFYKTDVAARVYIPSVTLFDDVPSDDRFKERFADELGKFALENSLMTFETNKDSSFGMLGSVMTMRATFLTEKEPEGDDKDA